LGQVETGGRVRSDLSSSGAGGCSRMSLSLQPVRVGTGSDEEGMLVFDDDQRLMAVLVHLSAGNEVAPGQ
jgi:hypothetical protein